MLIISQVLIMQACGQNSGSKDQLVNSTEPTGSNQDKLPDCEWCGAMDAPAALDWKTQIAPEGEPGEPLIISGTIYHPDGKTPAKDIILYAYHTNQKGVYPKKGNETGNGSRHGYLRGWMKTNAQGQYEFKTIKPNPYPTNNEPAHIHYTVSGKDYPEYWLNSCWFEGDPLITDKMKSRLARTGGFSNILALSRDENGTWRGTRNIVLEHPQ